MEYSHRTFTLYERLLTEPRVLLFHLSQLLIPSLSSFSIEHGFNLSTSFFSPWTTTPAILLCSSLIGLSLILLNKIPILSFGILFFFLSHTVESTILPLEIIHEHRNYLPSLFIFLPISYYIILFIKDFSPKKNRFVSLLLLLTITAFVSINVLTTINRNSLWETEETLWKDSLKNEPNSARPYLNLAKVFYEQNRLSEASQMCSIAFQKQLPTVGEAQALALTGQGAILMKYENYSAASKLFIKALSFKPDLFIARHSLVTSLFHENDFPNALKQISLILDENYLAPYLILKADILFESGRIDEAIIVYRETLLMSPLENRALIGIGKAMTILGNYRKADFFLRIAEKTSLIAALYRVKNEIAGGNGPMAEEYIEQLFQQYTVNDILQNAMDIENLMVASNPSSFKLTQLIHKQLEITN
jgi:tetratricopeptide (TPR) repeat protein